jgi:hypothetical protein
MDKAIAKRLNAKRTGGGAAVFHLKKLVDVIRRHQCDRDLDIQQFSFLQR